MAKGQQKSTKESKKPKKDSDSAKPLSGSLTSQVAAN